MSEPLQQERFHDLLASGEEGGGFSTDDVLAAVLPLMYQTLQAHQRGMVAPLQGIEHLVVQHGELRLLGTEAIPVRMNLARVQEMQEAARPSTAMTVIGESRLSADIDEGSLQVADLTVGAADAEITRPVYLPGYVSWEQRSGHHDVLTDIFSLGMLLASLACGLDFSSAGELANFVSARKGLHALAPHLHPVVATAIVRMTELNRHQRLQDLATVIQRLENYREQNFETPLDFSTDTQFRQATPHGKRGIILNHLRDRLFEISRRNRLIYFRSTMQTVNLTEGSVPIVLDYRNIKPRQLFYYHPELAGEFAKGKEINLGKYLRFDDAPYLAATLDRIRQEAVRDRKEFGFAQLRIALVFLRWHNLKETPEERIHSPLLLLPVELTKKKGVRDTYVVQPMSTVAEVNPALRHYLKELYNLELPEEVDLANPQNMEAFFDFLTAQISASEPGITLKKIDQPQIELIYESARQRLNAYHRRLRLAGRSIGHFGAEIDYSYARESYKPLGIQLFQRKVRTAPSPFDHLLRERPLTRHPFLIPTELPATGTESVKERALFTLRTGSEENPYVWDFDLCCATLGNFNYRKMTLVRDYARLLETEEANTAFDAVFSLQPQERFPADTSMPTPRDLHVIVPSDPTQLSAIAHARSGRCYIIQGPPGTGKSQTITNLIADYVARGQQVLFVCEKRAAIDVVYHRLRQQGLDKLAVLIHDSQTDKREFINDLRDGYATAEQHSCAQISTEQHAAALAEIDRELSILGHFSQAMSTVHAQAGVELRQLLHRLVELRDAMPELPATAQESLPPYRIWTEFGAVVRRLSETLRDIGEAPVFAQHPLRHVRGEVIRSGAPLATLQLQLTRAHAYLQRVADAMTASGLSLEQWNSVDAVLSLASYVGSIREPAACGQLHLTQPDDPNTKGYDRLCRDYESRVRKLEKARRETVHWREKLSPADTDAALAQARAVEGKLLRFLNPGWHRLHKVMTERYDFSRHVVKPRLTKLLEDLASEHQAAQVVAELEEQFTVNYQCREIVPFQSMVAAARAAVTAASPLLRQVHTSLLKQVNAQEVIQHLAALQEDAEALAETLESFFAHYRQFGLTQLQQELVELEAGLAHLHDLHADLLALCEVPEQLHRALCTLPLTETELEAGMGAKSLADAYRTDRTLQRFDGRQLARHLENLAAAYRRWMNLNGQMIVDRVCAQVQEHIRISSLPASQLTTEEKAFKQRYARGRRELEHEFGKTMRFKSIRDLVEAESGDVVFDLKPIWLMSPLSVADTLPLDTSRFDVVIFDEASQIRLEEAVPAIFRARQIIVVGDEMQLPPSNFFSAARGEEDSLLIDEDGDLVEYDLNADSLLSHATQNLPSTLLGWHYRSREEALISFSNNAFYRGELLTVPDCTLPREDGGEINVKTIEEAEENVAKVLQRGISYHFMETAVYAKRRNAMEATYIARMVRELLQRETGESIGIVAFSEAQQNEIESALDRLGEEDAAFRNRLETEMEREEDGQFCGLFIKNLENVQGDERDIIILSICYGYGADRRMLMNFGPINQTGGEKRLNVIFSRARRHMVVVSSIHHHDITNEYNDGANCLRNYLEYAAAVSRGDQATARRVLATLSPSRAREQAQPNRDAVIAELRQALQERGYLVDMEVGQSKFRCDLAVRLPQESTYRLAILVDTHHYYANPNLLERYLLRPGILHAFGWQVTQVLSKDWFHSPDDVLQGLERLLQRNSAEPLPEPDTESPEASAEAEIMADAQDATVNVLADTPQPEVNAATPPFTTPPATADNEQEAVLLTRYLEFRDAHSAKFWEVTVRHTRYTVHYGRIGAAGQTQIKDFATPERAVQEAEKIIREKLAKGYTDISSIR